LDDPSFGPKLTERSNVDLKDKWRGASPTPVKKTKALTPTAVSKAVPKKLILTKSPVIGAAKKSPSKTRPSFVGKKPLPPKKSAPTVAGNAPAPAAAATKKVEKKNAAGCVIM